MMLRSRLLATASARDGRAAFAFVLVAYGLFSLLDWSTTAVALAAGGREGNPVAASIFSGFGDAGLLVFKVLVVAVIIAGLVFVPRRIMSQRVALWVAAAFAVLAAFTVLHNVQAYASLLQAPHAPAYHTTAPEARLI